MDLTVVAMCSAGIALLVIGAPAAKRELAGAAGLDKIVALGNVCYAIPLAVFGALHLFGPGFVVDIVPGYMPWHMFWVYAVGCALIAAALSFATGRLTGLSGFLVGIMMFLFVAMIHLPGALSDPHDRFIWTIVLREMSFGGAGWILAGIAMRGRSGRSGDMLVTAGRVFVTMALIFFGVEHFLHPTALPGVPLRKLMPEWIPGREIIGYLTGAALLATGGSVLLGRKSRIVASLLGGWIVLLILVIYGPVLIAALSGEVPLVRLEGINYFADTLLFAGTVLALAKAAPRSEAAGGQH